MDLPTPHSTGAGHIIDAPADSGSFLASIPEGYVVATGPDNKKYVVPLHLVDNLKQVFESYRGKVTLGVHDWLPEANQKLQSKPTEYKFSNKDSPFPQQPPLTEQERLALHADIIAVQKLHGMSYKGAAQLLYMSEIAKARVAYESSKAFEIIADGLKASMSELEDKVRNTEL